MATFSKCNNCGTYMFTFGTCPKCGARKTSMTASQSIILGVTVLVALGLVMLVPLALLTVLGGVIRLAQWAMQ